MSNTRPQSYENHTKWVPWFHFFIGPLLAINLLLAIYVAITSFSPHTVSGLLVAVALFVLQGFVRAFPLGNQDRVIRLEERLRMHRLLPDDLQPRIDDFTTDQLVALRFASDEELPSLARKVLDEGIGDRKTIKQMVGNWRPDDQRI